MQNKNLFINLNITMQKNYLPIQVMNSKKNFFPCFILYIIICSNIIYNVRK